MVRFVVKAVRDPETPGLKIILPDGSAIYVSPNGYVTRVKDGKIYVAKWEGGRDAPEDYDELFITSSYVIEV
ncbi:MAG: hypothetical protein ABWK05_02720 [Pyrobaculum sp.]